MMEINLKHPVLFLDSLLFLPVKVSPSSQKRRVEAPPLPGGERILFFLQTKIKKVSFNIAGYTPPTHCNTRATSSQNSLFIK